MISRAFILLLLFCTVPVWAQQLGPQILISEHDQKLALVQGDSIEARYPISSSKFGLGDQHGSYKTPLGRLFVSHKLGNGLQSGTVIKNRRTTGEVLKVNAPGRDPIVSRVLWLSGLEPRNRNAHERCIYIHGTPEERTLGSRTSYGCIRMRSKDVIELFQKVDVGTVVVISTEPLSKLLPQKPNSFFAGKTASKNASRG